jgi:hypothetical protein
MMKTYGTTKSHDGLANQAPMLARHHTMGGVKMRRVANDVGGGSVQQRTHWAGTFAGMTARWCEVGVSVATFQWRGCVDRVL